MRTDWLKPLTELAHCVIVPLARCVGMWGYDLLCYHKVVKELEKVTGTLKWVHADIQGAVNFAKHLGQVVNEGRTVLVWIREAETVIKQLEETKLDSKVESRDKLSLMMMCLDTRCCNCGDAQKEIKEAKALITEAKNFFLPHVWQEQSTYKIYGGKGLARSSSTSDINPKISGSQSLAINDDQVEMEDALMSEEKTFNLRPGGGHAKTHKISWDEVLARWHSESALPITIDDELGMEENLLA